MKKDISAPVKEALAGLPERVREVLEFGYGQCGYPATAEAVRDDAQKCEERIRQRSSQALKKLTKPSRGQGLSSFLD